MHICMGCPCVRIIKSVLTSSRLRGSQPRALPIIPQSRRPPRKGHDPPLQCPTVRPLEREREVSRIAYRRRERPCYRNALFYRVYIGVI